MVMDDYETMHIADFEKDEIHLLYPDRLDGWNIKHRGYDKVW